MARVTEAILGAKGYGRGHTSPMVDLSYGAQLGFSPDLREWVSNAAYVRRHVFCLLLEAPRFFQLMPDSQKWTEALRMLFEMHPLTIEGLQAGLEVATDETPVGGGGEMQEEVVNVTRQRTTPTFTFHDKYGAPINTFLRNWIEYGLMNPQSKVANVGTLSGNYPEDMLPDWYSATAIFIEPDPTHRKVVRSWLCTNMWPKTDGEVVGSRDLRSNMNLSNLSIQFSAIAQYGLGVDILAQQLMDQLVLDNANPHLRPAFVEGVSADVDAVQRGYKHHVQDLSQTALQTP